MAKSREKVQQLGFWDAEVSTPDHDAVCLWAYENADLIFQRACPELFGKPWRSEDVQFGYDDKTQDAIVLAKAFMSENPRPNPRVSRKTLEYVLKSRTGYQDKIERIVGYADLLIETALPRVFPTYTASSAKLGVDVLDGFELGWSSEGRESPRILVEAKSVLPTVGELMRQVQLYRTAFYGVFVVVSPDDSYAKILSEQGVIFVKSNL